MSGNDNDQDVLFVKLICFILGRLWWSNAGTKDNLQLTGSCYEVPISRSGRGICWNWVRLDKNTFKPDF